MIEVLCLACQFGHHEDHQEIVRAVQEGMLGGSKCPCKGDCAGNLSEDAKLLLDAPRTRDRGSTR